MCAIKTNCEDFVRQKVTEKILSFHLIWKVVERSELGNIVTRIIVIKHCDFLVIIITKSQPHTQRVYLFKDIVHISAVYRLIYK